LTFLYFSLKGKFFAGKEGFLLSKMTGNGSEKAVYCIVCMRFFSKAGTVSSPNFARRKKNYEERKKIFPFSSTRDSFFIFFRTRISRI
ncbi:MAG: hypothetical protein IK000_06830, partial [Bacteroidaceae bacterium]|nr:hypothetical protein [Bacteroidaceae bacterium]